jgi:hypothetical protein
VSDFDSFARGHLSYDAVKRSDIIAAERWDGKRESFLEILERCRRDFPILLNPEDADFMDGLVAMDSYIAHCKETDWRHLPIIGREAWGLSESEKLFCFSPQWKVSEGDYIVQFQSGTFYQINYYFGLPLKKWTQEDLDCGRSKNGGWGKRELAFFGVDFPATKGWESRLLLGENPNKQPTEGEFKRIPDGRWVVQVPARGREVHPGDIVEVVRVNGEYDTVIVTEVIKRNVNYALCFFRKDVT